MYLIKYLAIFVNVLSFYLQIANNTMQLSRKKCQSTHLVNLRSYSEVLTKFRQSFTVKLFPLQLGQLNDFEFQIPI